jgi:branched-chain amino acid transport system substrate-binding protein
MWGTKVLSGLALAALAVLMLPVAGLAQNCPKGTIKLVTSWPMQGAMVPEGTAMKRAVDLAVAKYNGVVAGYCIKVENQDDASPVTGSWDGTVEADIAQKAVADKDVMVYLATYNSGAAKISMPITNKAGLAQVTPANTYPGLTKPGFGPGEPEIYRPSNKVNYFRTHPADDLQGAAAAAWAACLSFKKVFVLDDRQLYGKGIADVFEAKAKKLGMAVVGHEGVETTSMDFRALLTKVKASGANLVYGGFVIDSGGVQVIQQMKALGMFDLGIKFMGPDGLYSPGLIEQATADAVNGNVLVTFAALPPNKLPTKTGQEFFQAYVKKYGEEPIGWAVYAYNAALVSLDAIKRAGAKDRAKILSAVTATKNFDGVAGRFSFDKNGDTTRTDMAAYAVKDGKWDFQYPISGDMAPKRCPKQ